MMSLNRAVRSFLIETKTSSARDLLVSTALSSALDVIFSNTIDLDVSRLAFGVILSVFETCFGAEKRYVPDNEEIAIIICRLLPILSDAFNIYMDYCESKSMLQPKRTFTQLFPSTYPFEEYPVDAYVQDVAFCEALMELTVLVCFSCKAVFTVNKAVAYVFIERQTYSGNFSALDCYIGKSSKYGVDSQDLVRDGKNRSVITTEAFRKIIDPKYYPGSKWISMKALANVCVVEVFDVVKDFLFVPAPDHPEFFDTNFWRAFTFCSLETATGKSSSLEHLNSVAKKACYNITGDIRSHLAKTLYAYWNKWGFECTEEEQKRFQVDRVGGFQKFIYVNDDFNMLTGLIRMSLQRNKECSLIASKMIWEILVAEWLEKKDFYSIEREIVSGLYDAFFSAVHYCPGPAEIENIANIASQMRCGLDIEDEVYHPLLALTTTMLEFASTAVHVMSIPHGEEFDDTRMFSKINISSYLMKVDKPELLHSLINEMYETNMAKKNFVQAALSLQLLADTYEWDTSYYLPECKGPVFPSQSEFKRKEELYKLIASNFMKGGNVYHAIDAYNELLDAYRKYNFDLDGLSFCHGELCKAYSAVENTGTLESSFFKVSFIGLGFPVIVRGKEYIYED
ncbi:unnamed protein product [Ambrosiozyma monospora]|uniref:Unnamed protein product n=1 Tax=Ambrosiozyma monospora TaxID=43982 RepID=A0ACB5T7W9_AMBMO|nr:unnamed protein product [Ambrosiozyma monospora]